MSRLLDYATEVLARLCCGSLRNKAPENRRLSYYCDSSDFDDGSIAPASSVPNITFVRVEPSESANNNLKPFREEKQYFFDSMVLGYCRSAPSSITVASNSNAFVMEVQAKLLDGLMKIFSDTLETLILSVCPVGKARRKDKDAGSGPSSSVGTGNDEGKLYLESALLERHLNETDLIRLVGMPPGLEKNEWMASHTIALFDHVNLIYGTISEFCTPTSCPDMTGPCMRTYLWFDERGKKVKVAAPQYIDYVMTFIQKTINDESLFPTKSTNAFPSSFQDIVKKICRLMFHVIAHIYHSHFKEIVLLSIHAHLNCVFAHFMTFNEIFKLVEDKETEILQDLSLAMKLRSNIPPDDDPMCDSNKENIIVSKSSSFQSEPSNEAARGMASGSTSAFVAEDALLIKDSALVNAVSDSQ